MMSHSQISRNGNLRTCPRKVLLRYDCCNEASSAKSDAFFREKARIQSRISFQMYFDFARFARYRCSWLNHQLYL